MSNRQKWKDWVATIPVEDDDLVDVVASILSDTPAVTTAEYIIELVRADYEAEVLEAVESVGNYHSNPLLRDCVEMCRKMFSDAIKGVSDEHKRGK